MDNNQLQPQAHILNGKFRKDLGSTKVLRVTASMVKPLSNSKRRKNSIGITGVNAESRTTWIDVGPKGEWAGHSEGPFVLDDATFDSIIKHFKTQKSRPQVDYGHGSLYETDGQPKPCAGFILDLQVQNDRLWAKVEFTKRAANYIRAGEYRYCSGVFCWDVIDPQSGDTVYAILDSIALTNRPFIDGQNPIMLSHVPSSSKKSTANNKKMISQKITNRKALSMTKDELIEALSKLLGEEVTPEMATEALKNVLNPSEAEVASAAELPADKEKEAKTEAKKEEETPKEGDKKEVAAADLPEEALAEETEEEDMLGSMPDPFKAVADALEMDLAALGEALLANLDAIEPILVGTAGENVEGDVPPDMVEALPASTTAALSQVRALTAKLNKMQAHVANERKSSIEKEVDTLVKAGKILPSARKEWVALANSDIGSFRTLAKGLPVVVPLSKSPPATASSQAQLIESPENIPASHPKYVALAAEYKRDWPSLANNPSALDNMVRKALARTTKFGA